MSFDVNQAVQDKITHLEDEVKNLKHQRDVLVGDLETQLNAKQDELDGWVSILGDDKKSAPAKKAAAKK